MLWGKLSLMTELTPSPFEMVDWEDDSGQVYPWGPQPGEGSLAFHYFTVYRDLGPTRSVAKAARSLQKDAHFLRQLSAKNAWVDRAMAFDAFLDRASVESLVRGRTQMRQEYADIADLAKKKIVARLRTLDPDEMSVRDLATWLDLTAKIERQARGEADKTLRIEGELTVVDQLPTDQRRSLMEEARRVLNARLGVKDSPELEAYVDAEVVEDAGQEGES